MRAAALLLTACATLLLVLSERRATRIGIWICKPIASLGFIAFAWTSGADTGHAPWLLAALCACALGDVLLIPNDERAFQAGVASFGLGHGLYAVAFAVRGVHVPAAAGAALLLALLAWRIYRWLAP